MLGARGGEGGASEESPSRSTEVSSAAARVRAARRSRPWLTREQWAQRVEAHIPCASAVLLRVFP